MKTLNNKGMTLVEVVLAIVILGIGAMMLAEGFSAAARMTNRATHYRNASVATSSTLEVEEVVESKDPKVSVDLDYKDASSGITIKYKKNGVDNTLTLPGQYAISNETNTDLTYREFCPDNFSFVVPAEPVGD
ncbi:MAG: type II secretion system protein [Oscillospiraceae bacterium]|nr:type II secretion system protein [Candidatus Limimonas egerieequi]